MFCKDVLCFFDYRNDTKSPTPFHAATFSLYLSDSLCLSLLPFSQHAVLFVYRSPGLKSSARHEENPTFILARSLEPPIYIQPHVQLYPDARAAPPPLFAWLLPVQVSSWWKIGDLKCVSGVGRGSRFRLSLVLDSVSRGVLPCPLARAVVPSVEWVL